MKKIILFVGLLIMGISFTGCFSKNQNFSLNGVLSYEMPENWQESENDSGAIEVSLESKDTKQGLILEYIEINENNTPENFLAYQEQFISAGGGTVEEEEVINFPKKKVVRKVFKVKEISEELSFLAGTIEYKNEKNKFVGFIATITGDDFTEVYEIVDSVKPTGEKLDKERIVSYAGSGIQMSIPPNWKKLEKGDVYSFFKSTDDSTVYTYASLFNKNDVDPDQAYEDLKKQFLEDFKDAKVYKEFKDEKFEDKVISGTVYSYNVDGEDVYSYFSIINFDNSDICVVLNHDIATLGKFEDLEEELKYINSKVSLSNN